MNQNQKNVLLLSLKEDKELELKISHLRIGLFSKQLLNDLDLKIEELELNVYMFERTFVLVPEIDEQDQDDYEFCLKSENIISYDSKAALEFKRNILMENEPMDVLIQMKFKESNDKNLKREKNLMKMKTELLLSVMALLNESHFFNELKCKVQIQEEKSKIIFQDLDMQLVIDTNEPLYQLEQYRNQEKNFETKKQLDISSTLEKFMSLIYTNIQKTLTLYINFSKKSKNTQDFKKFNTLTETQKINFINIKQVAFLKELISSNYCGKTQQDFALEIQKIFYNYLQMGNISISELDFDSILNKMNLDFSKITKILYDNFLDENEEQIPIELIHQRRVNDQNQIKFLNFFQEDDDIFITKIKEYEKVGFYYSCEKFMLNKQIENPENPQLWYQLMVFYLRRQRFEDAENCILKLYEFQSPNPIIKRLKICFLLQRNRYKSVFKQIQENLKEDKWSILDNLFMCIYQERVVENKLKARKYFRVAVKKYLKNNPSKSQYSENLLHEEVWKELIQFLLKFCFVDIVEQIIDKLELLKVFKILVKGNIECIRGEFFKSNEFLDLILSLEESQGHETKEALQQYKQDAVLTKACNLYFVDYHYEAEFIFLEYLQMKEKIRKNEILLILGFSYFKRQAFSEALEIFNFLGKQNQKSILIWLGIAQSAFYLNQIDLAEEALSNFVKLNPNEANPWVLFLLINIKKFQSKEIDVDILRNLVDIYLSQENENLLLLNQAQENLKNIDQNLQLKCQEKLDENFHKFKDLGENKFFHALKGI